MPLRRRCELSLMINLLFFCFGIESVEAFISSRQSQPFRNFGQVNLNGRRIEFSPRRISKLMIIGRDDEITITKEEDSTIESKSALSSIFGSPRVEVSNDESADKNYMGDLTKLLGKDENGGSLDEIESIEEENSINGIFAIAGITAATLALFMGFAGDTTEISLRVQSFFADPAASLEAVVETVQSMGPLGYLYFGAVYTAAEILAIPAIPLTASAGYLFGVRDGTAVVLLSASIAAAVSFIIGRTFLRDYVEKALDNYPDFKKMDKAIGEDGFKIMLLLRLSPVFPFALSNYLYGVTSIKFWPYFWGTMIGFTPGTIAYVFTGEIGKSLTLDSASSEPWYVYVGALALLSGFIKFASDTATGIIEKVQEEEE